MILIFVVVAEVDCNQVKLGQPIFRDCHSFYICAFPQYDPYIYGCPKGTVCDPRNGECKNIGDVEYCKNK